MANIENAPPPLSTDSTALIEAVDKIKAIEEEAEKEGVGFVDVLSEKILSRKLLVWIVATTFLGLGKITADEWMSISLGYIGIQGVADLATKWKKG